MENSRPKPTLLHQLIAIAILLIFLGSLVILGWLIFNAISELSIRELTPILTIMIPAIVAIITAGATIYAAIRTKSAERIKEIEQELRKQKAPIYEGFSEFLLGKVLKNEASEDEMKEFVINFSQKMLVWGGDDVIKAWVDFRKNIVNEEFQYEGLFLMENVIFAIRSDMGHSNRGLKQGDLLTLFINDMEKVLESQKLSLNQKKGSIQNLKSKEDK